MKTQRAKQHILRRTSTTNCHFLILFMLLVWGGSVPLWSQQFEITPLIGYRFGGSLSNGDVEIDDNLQVGDIDLQNTLSFGVILGLPVAENIHLEFFYDRQPSELILKERGDRPETRVTDLKVDHWHLGVAYTWPFEYLQPMAGFTFGITSLIPKEKQFSTRVRGSGTFHLGAKLFLSDRIGIRAQMRVTGTYITSNDQLYCDENRFCFTRRESTFMYQAGLHGGLIIAF